MELCLTKLKFSLDSCPRHCSNQIVVQQPSPKLLELSVRLASYFDIIGIKRTF